MSDGRGDCSAQRRNRTADTRIFSPCVHDTKAAQVPSGHALTTRTRDRYGTSDGDRVGATTREAMMRARWTPEREKAERRASKALDRSGFDPDAIDPLYGENVWKAAVDHLASWLLLQFDDPLPRERTGPITTDELRDRASDRKWRCQCPRFRTTDATPIAIDPHTDDIPF